MNLIIKQMNTQSTQDFKNRLIERGNGNPNGLTAIVAGLGRTAARNGVCLFACPYEAGSEYAEVWMAAHSEEVNKMGEKILTA